MARERLTDGEMLLLACTLYQAQRDAARNRPCSHNRCAGGVHACSDSARAFLEGNYGRLVRAVLHTAPERIQRLFLDWTKAA